METLTQTDLNTLSLMNSTYPFTMCDKSSLSHACAVLHDCMLKTGKNGRFIHVTKIIFRNAHSTKKNLGNWRQQKCFEYTKYLFIVKKGFILPPTICEALEFEYSCLQLVNVSHVSHYKNEIKKYFLKAMMKKHILRNPMRSHKRLSYIYF